MSTTTERTHDGSAAPRWHRRMSLMQLVVVVLFTAAATCSVIAAEPGAVTIPFVKGLTVVYAVSESQGDYESLHTIASVGGDGYRLKVSAQTPGSEQADAAIRTVDRRDQGWSHRIRSWFAEGEPELFPDTVPGFSRMMLNELALGDTHLVYLQIESGFVRNHVRRSLSGKLRLVGEEPETMSMLVNGKEVELSVVHGKGKLGDGEGVVSAEYFVLNDEDNPIVLRATVGEDRMQAVRIEYPVAGDASDSMEQQLARGETVAVHSVYFDFASATIRPESQRTLDEIASILEHHKDWRLQIDGHTDAIGGDADNLKLSQQRAEAVKAALASQHGIDAARLGTAGYGESQAVDTNDTAEGRSHNRRVELRRL